MPRSDKKDVNELSNDEFEDILRSQKKVAQVEGSSDPSSGSVVVNFLVATAVSAMPIYLYLSAMFEQSLTIEEHAVYFGVVTLVSAVFLTLAYGKTAEREVLRLVKLANRRPQRAPVSKSRRGKKGKGKGTDSDSEAPKQSASDAVNAGITVQAVSYAMYYNNVLFLVLFLVLAFNVMPNVVPSFINYIVSVVGPSVVAFMLS